MRRARPSPHPEDGHGLIAGVDGCRSGWVVALLDLVCHEVEWRVVPTLRTVLDVCPHGALVAVDIPIGLPDRPPRRCDVEARRLLGPRRSSVFPAPTRDLLRARSYDEANALSRRLYGSGVPRQAFNIYPRIAEADREMTPELQRRVFESHPELAFLSLAGAPLASSKREPGGLAERRKLLSSELDATGFPERIPGAAEHDLLDAAALALVALRASYGLASRLPSDPPLDRRGLRMEIVF